MKRFLNIKIRGGVIVKKTFKTHRGGKIAKYLLFMAFLFIALMLSACDDNIDLQLTKVHTFQQNQVLDFDYIENNSVINAEYLCVQINLEDLPISNSWKENYDLDSMTNEEIDLLIKEHRQESKNAYEKYNQKFISENSLTDLNGTLEYSKYAPVIYLEYNSYNDMLKDTTHLNTILTIENVENIELYID